MAKPRKKKRTQDGAATRAENGTAKGGSRSPKSMVIRMGASEVGASVSQLVKDVRTMMEPDTASRLQERKSNRLRDYTTMAGPLGVTHLLLFSRSKNGNTNLRLAVTPRGPTLHFRVEEYSLCKDIEKSQKRPKSGMGAGAGSNGKEGLSPPLLVMNNFITQIPADDGANGQHKQHVPKHLESLTTTVFQSLFPPINPTATPLRNIKRVLLLDRVADQPSDAENSYVLDLRHYTIETRTAKSVPKPLRRIDAAEKLPHAGQKRKRGALPNLGKLNDVADYLLDPHAADGFTSGSDSEPETDAEVEVLAPTAQRVQRRDQRKAQRGEKGASQGDRAEENEAHVEKKGIKLHELGPRLRLRLTKVEEGLCAGRVMWHDYIKKSAAEESEMEKIHEQRRAEKERRRAEQKARVEAKKQAKKGDGQTAEDEDNEEETSDDELWDDDDEEVENGDEGEDVEVDDAGD